MNSHQLDEARERKRHEHVARELGIPVATLDDHHYELEAVNHGIVWRILWEDTVPPGVEAHGAVGSQWSDIHPLDEPDRPEAGVTTG